MTNSPTVPPWAAQCWVEDGKLHVNLPDTPNLVAHRLTFPCDLQGMHRLRALLENRNAHSTLGTQGDLTQYQLDKKLRQQVDITGKTITRKPKDTFAPELRAGARTILRNLGLIGAVRR